MKQRRSYNNLYLLFLHLHVVRPIHLRSPPLLPSAFHSFALPFSLLSFFSRLVTYKAYNIWCSFPSPRKECILFFGGRRAGHYPFDQVRPYGDLNWRSERKTGEGERGVSSTKYCPHDSFSPLPLHPLLLRSFPKAGRWWQKRKWCELPSHGIAGKAMSKKTVMSLLPDWSIVITSCTSAIEKLEISYTLNRKITKMTTQVTSCSEKASNSFLWSFGKRNEFHLKCYCISHARQALDNVQIAPVWERCNTVLSVLLNKSTLCNWFSPFLWLSMAVIRDKKFMVRWNVKHPRHAGTSLKRSGHKYSERFRSLTCWQLLLQRPVRKSGKLFVEAPSFRERCTFLLEISHSWETPQTLSTQSQTPSLQKGKRRESSSKGWRWGAPLLWNPTCRPRRRSGGLHFYRLAWAPKYLVRSQDIPRIAPTLDPQPRFFFLVLREKKEEKWQDGYDPRKQDRRKMGFRLHEDRTFRSLRQNEARSQISGKPSDKPVILLFLPRCIPTRVASSCSSSPCSKKLKFFVARSEQSTLSGPWLTHKHQMNE